MTETQEALEWAESGDEWMCHTGKMMEHAKILAKSLRSLLSERDTLKAAIAAQRQTLEAERDTLAAKLKIAEEALLWIREQPFNSIAPIIRDRCYEAISQMRDSEGK